MQFSLDAERPLRASRSAADAPACRSRARLSSSEEEPDQLVAAQFVVPPNVSEEAAERTDPYRVVIRDGDVMLTVPIRGQADMAARLSRCPVAELLQRLDQVLSR
jgi:hypothetical protein